MKENARFATKFRAVVLACIAFAIAGTSGPAAAVTLYAVDSKGMLWLLDTMNRTKTQIGSNPLPTNSDWFVGLDVNPADGKLYVSNSVTGSIFTVNTSTGAATLVTTVDIKGSPCGLGVTQNLAFSPSGVLYGSESSSLCTINLGTGGSASVGSDFSFPDDNGLAFAPNGTLYAIGQGGSTGRSLYSINPANGAKTFISSSPCNFVGLTFAPDGNLYCTSFTGYLYQLNPSNGAATQLFDAGLGSFNDLASASALNGPAVPQPRAVTVVEFYNTMLQHYFMTADSTEAAAIDGGSAGPGWQRTGASFSAWSTSGARPANAADVCRFYGTPGRGPNSHFYTAATAECAAVKKDSGWTYEGVAFYILTPVNDQCAVNQRPVYRAYNNGFARNDSNHRYSTDQSILQSMTSQGWGVEGVVFCSPSN